MTDHLQVAMARDQSPELKHQTMVATRHDIPMARRSLCASRLATRWELRQNVITAQIFRPERLSEAASNDGL
jgi:hypothetical protein